MPGCFAVLGNIAATTRKFVNNVRALAGGISSYNWKKLEIRVDDLKITNFTEGKVFTDTIFETRS